MLGTLRLYPRLDERDLYQYHYLRHSYIGGRDYVTPPPGTVDPARGRRTRAYVGRGDNSEQATRQTRQEFVGGGTYLVPHERESQADYLVRLQAALAINLCAPVVDRYVSTVHSRPITRELPEPLASVSAAERSGADVDTLMRSATRWALVYGVAYLVTDLPSSPEGGYASQLEAERARAGQPYSWICPPQHLLDWALDESGGFVGALVCEGPEPRAFAPTVEKVTPPMLLRSWSPESWTLYRSHTAGELERVAEGEGYGFVPLVPVVYRRVPDVADAYVGRSLLQDAADIQCEIFNLLSIIQDAHRAQAASVLFVPQTFGDGKVDPLTEIVLSTHRVNSFNGEAGAPQWIAAPTEPIVEKRLHCEWLAQRLTESVGLAKRGKDTAQVASGEALRWDNVEFADLASEAASMAERAEREWHAQRLALMTGVDVDAAREQVQVQYPREFAPIDPEALTRQLQAVIDAGVQGEARLEAEVQWARRYFAGLDPERVEEIVEDVRREAETAALSREAEALRAAQASQQARPAIRAMFGEERHGAGERRESERMERAPMRRMMPEA